MQNKENVENKQPKSRYWSSIVAGGVSSLVVVSLFYPLDTLKTRIQAAEGFEKAGGCRGLYKGFFLFLIIGTIPINCLFYGTYEVIKSYGEQHVTPQYLPAMHMCAASFCRAAGGVSSLVVVSLFYPLDTLKTRIQAAEGFEKAGGCRGLYKGFFLFLIIGTIPINCLFYGTYEVIKSYGEQHVTPQYLPAMHMCAASFCRALVCLIRVPAEILKQRNQAVALSSKKIKGFSVLIEAYRQEGIRRGLYRGLSSTLLRDVPYTNIEMPTWELLKKTISEKNNTQITPFQSGVCGLGAGVIAGTFTTPLDVAKTRIILANTKAASKRKNICIRSVLRGLYMESGIRGLFKGYSLRIWMIMMGRFIFYSMYEKTRMLVEFYLDYN